MLTILVSISATFCYIVPKICQKPHAKTRQKPSKNPLKICDKNFFWTKIFYHLTKN